MQKFLLYVVASQLFLMSSALGAEPPNARRMDDYQWEKRVLVLVSAPDAEALAQQLSTLSDDIDALDERDLVVLQLSGQSTIALYGDDQAPSAEMLRTSLRLGNDTDFEILLIGKDGDIKLRSPKPLEANEIFQVIDAMPMRLQEMRNQR